MRVKTADVYPSGNNPRVEFGDIEELAASFELTPGRPGEPVNPPLLVKDGGVYLIWDGERRWRAMRLLGKRDFLANVCDDADEADAVLAALATDMKKHLDPVERSRGVQRVLALGVAPMKVEKLPGLKGAARAKRAMQRVGDAAQDMSFDRLLAIEEFADDEKAVAKLVKCPESDWRPIAAEYRRKRKAERDRAEMERVLERHGVEVSGAIDWGRYTTFISGSDPEKIDAALSSAGPAKRTALRASVNSAGYCTIVSPRPHEEPAEADGELEQRKADLVEAYASERARWRSWFGAVLQSGKAHSLQGLSDALSEAFAFEAAEMLGDGWPEAEGGRMSRTDWAIGYSLTAPSASDMTYAVADAVLRGRTLNYVVGIVHSVYDFMDLLEEARMPADTPGWQLLRDSLQEFLDGEGE